MYAATANATINVATAVAIRVRKNLLMVDDAGTAISFQRATIGRLLLRGNAGLTASNYPC